MAILEEVQKRFEADVFATGVTGCKILEAQAGHSICTLQPTPQHCNAAGTVMGGAIFTLADFAFAVAANTDSPLTVSLNNSISFLRPGKGDLLTAEAVCVNQGRTTCLYEVRVTPLGCHGADQRLYQARLMGPQNNDATQTKTALSAKTVPFFDAGYTVASGSEAACHRAGQASAKPAARQRQSCF